MKSKISFACQGYREDNHLAFADLDAGDLFLFGDACDTPRLLRKKLADAPTAPQHMSAVPLGQYIGIVGNGIINRARSDQKVIRFDADIAVTKSTDQAPC